MLSRLKSGRAGGAVINLITKSGTNAFHGGAYEYLFRNDKLNANDFFANSAGIGRAEFRQNQFGGSVGGRIKKDKTFFFADIENLRLIQGKNTGVLAAPTAFELAHPGNFSDVCGKNGIVCERRSCCYWDHSGCPAPDPVAVKEVPGASARG